MGLEKHARMTENAEAQILEEAKSCRKRKRELGQMADMPEYSIPYNQIKKIANFKAQIFGL